MATPPKDALNFDPDDPFNEDFGFEIVDSPDLVIEEKKGEIKEVYAQRMQAVEKLILPLLQNLLKNPEKEYIKWGNRTQVITKQIDRITSITRKPLDA